MINEFMLSRTVCFIGGLAGHRVVPDRLARPLPHAAQLPLQLPRQLLVRQRRAVLQPQSNPQTTSGADAARSHIAAYVALRGSEGVLGPAEAEDRAPVVIGWRDVGAVTSGGPWRALGMPCCASEVRLGAMNP